MRATRFQARALVDKTLCQVNFSFFFFCLLFIAFYRTITRVFSPHEDRSCTLSFGTRKTADFILSHGSEIFNNNNKNGDISRCVARCELAASLKDLHANARAKQERDPGKYLDNLLNVDFSWVQWRRGIYGFVLWIYVLFILDV